jgi:ribosomal protein uS13
MAEESYKHIVRVMNTDLDGRKPIGYALTKIKGIGFMYSNLVCKLSHVDWKKRAGNLTNDEISEIEKVIRNPLEAGAPIWLLNRRKDPEDGKDKHLLTAELDFNKDNDIKMMKKIKAYRGLRHAWGLPVRGQRTRSNFRKNKAIGVSKKKATEKK